MDNFNLKKYLAENVLLNEFSDAAFKKALDQLKDNPERLKKHLSNMTGPIHRMSGGLNQTKIDNLRKFLVLMDEEGVKIAEGKLTENKLLKEDRSSKLLLKVLKAYQPEVEQQLGTKLANWRLDDMDDASATDVDELTGFSFKIASKLPMDFKGGGFGDDDTDPEIIDIANKKIAVIKYNL